MIKDRGFRLSRAVELAELVGQAYVQFEAAETGGAWSLQGGYELLRELEYERRPQKEGGALLEALDGELRRILGGRAREAERIPLGFVARRGRDAYLVFRGTKTTKEWIGNFTMGLEDYPFGPYGRVHHGFLDSYRELREAIMAGLGGLSGRSRLYIAGHSLGGALASLAAPDIEGTRPGLIRGIYTFGSPRAGDRVFAQGFDSSFGGISFRIANNSDLVPSIPPPAPMMGVVGSFFTHVGALVDIGVQREDQVENHRIATYLEELRRIEGAAGPLGRALLRAQTLLAARLGRGAGPKGGAGRGP